jgi:predicted GNAT family N-acyltransferase
LSKTESANQAPDSTGLTMKRFRKSESPSDFEQALHLRTVVFVDEQAVPMDEERDEYDDEALHWLILDDATGEPVATGRMMSYQEGCQMRPVAKIGRIAVSRARRGQKLGDWVMREILNTVREAGYAQAILDAQTQVIPFYEKLGFVAEGDEFMDAGISHYRMRLVLD